MARLAACTTEGRSDRPSISIAKRARASVGPMASPPSDQMTYDQLPNPNEGSVIGPAQAGELAITRNYVTAFSGSRPTRLRGMAANRCSTRALARMPSKKDLTVMFSLGEWLF